MQPRAAGAQGMLVLEPPLCLMQASVSLAQGSLQTKVVTVD